MTEEEKIKYNNSLPKNLWKWNFGNYELSIYHNLIGEYRRPNIKNDNNRSETTIFFIPQITLYRKGYRWRSGGIGIFWLVVGFSIFNNKEFITNSW